MATAVTVALAVGCAQSPEATSAGAADQQVCEDQAPTGSTIKVRRCRTPEQAARERASADNAAAQIRTNVPQGQTGRP